MSHDFAGDPRYTTPTPDKLVGETLKACPTPWCSRYESPYIFERRADIVGVCCLICSVSTPYCKNKAEAIAIWNRQTPPPSALDEVVAKVSEMLDDWNHIPDDASASGFLNELTFGELRTLITRIEDSKQ